MNDNPLDKIPTFNRVSIRAVLVQEGQDPGPALAEAGLINPVALPVVVGDDPDLPNGILGDGFTDNLTAVLETDPQDTSNSSADPQHGDGLPQSAPNDPQPAARVAVNLPAAYGLRPMAPGRKIGT